MTVPITTFISTFNKIGVAKPNQYMINILDYRNNFSKTNSIFYAKSATTPSFTVKEMQVPYMGRIIKLPLTSRTYEDITFTFIADEKYNNRKFFETWNSEINSHQTNEFINNSNVKNYLTSSIYIGLNSQTSSISSFGIPFPFHNYILENAFPKEIGPITLAYDNNNTVAEFTVTFCYTNLRR